MFEVAASYDRFMGRYSEPLAAELVSVAGLPAGSRCLDVGCGPGALIAALVRQLGAETVSAADPSTPFVEAARARFPDVDVQRAPAEDLPYEDGSFDAAFAALVVHFMEDPVAGLREMGRVVRPGGLVAASVWDFGGGRGPLSLFWQVVVQLDPGAQTESALPGARRGHLVELAAEAGLVDPVERELTVTSAYRDFDEWWEPYTLGVGPAGAYVGTLDEEDRVEVREHCRRLLPQGPFEVEATAWAVLAQSAVS